jgi:hypothetical protein
MDSYNSAMVFQSLHIRPQVGANSHASSVIKSHAQTTGRMLTS